MTPTDRKYTSTHEWVKFEGTNATIGISDHAQEALGDITFVELPAAGKTIEAGKECGVIESVKAASDLYAPIGGVVTEVNSKLTTGPELINKDPYNAGWLFRLKDCTPQPNLLDAAAYDKQLTSEQ